MSTSKDFEMKSANGNPTDIVEEPTSRDRRDSAPVHHLTVMHGNQLGFMSRNRIDSDTRRAIRSKAALLNAEDFGTDTLPKWYKSPQDLRFFTVFFLTFGYFFVEIVYGMRIGSLALVADAMHMLSDVIALLVGWYVFRTGQREKTLKSTYGWTRMEIVGALINGTFMLSVCLNITLEAIERFVSGEEAGLEDGTDSLINISAIGLALNVVGFIILSTGETDNGSKEFESVELGEVCSTHSQHEADEPESKRGCFRGIDMNMQGVLLHVLGDAMGSVAVIASSLIIKHTDGSNRFLADPISSLIIVLLIVVGTVPLVRDSAAILLQRAPSDVDTETVIKSLLRVQPVLVIHDFHMWSLTTENVVATMHVILPIGCDFMKISSDIQKTLRKFGVRSATIQPEYIAPEDLKGGIFCHTARSNKATTQLPGA